ncbi:UbiA prenyltransferase family-domain-containing protein [Dichomitus squalens]|uniref:UbiA prenyltransferase family-domain-containing protein n=1 Tax=Dichomitus squalens TaxID=114155 RepID=A0A4Q9NFM7_9APHY|nr:UbiA prenyltransferase family-domain-containing protein [Dichomitus squalens]TBU52062.1 UbiA prenyltransferase family-domain-containing protein [Dichomitus squalens]
MFSRLITVSQPRPSLQPSTRRRSRLVHVLSGLMTFIRHCGYHARTAMLFTASDLKTILLPISAFACATAPLCSFDRLLRALIWTWIHQFMCNVSNQARTRLEDAVNKPWRPLPAGRITERQAFVLRWVTVAAAFGCSALHGGDLMLTTLGLLLTTFAYDELGLAGHLIGKSICNIGGYTTLEIGATKLMGATRDLDNVSATAVCISGALICTTIQAQDFADVEGDAILGRKTFPIYAPEFSRIATVTAISVWSLFLASFWGIGSVCGAIFVVFGSFVGSRFYSLRGPDDDELSYVLYNVSKICTIMLVARSTLRALPQVWLTMVHIMPNHARTGLFTF